MTTRARAARLLADPPRLAVLGLCGAVLALRRAQALTNPQFWAEDGHFYERAYSLGWRSLLLPYAGYFHALPRMIGYGASLIDPGLAPGTFAACAALLTLYAASLALSGRCPLPRFAGLIALSVVLVPDTYEVLLNVVNLQWVLGAGLVLVLISRDPSGPGPWIHDAAAAALLGLTGPFSILLAPLFVWRAWRRGTRASAVLAAVVVACALLQGFLLCSQSGGGHAAPGDHFQAGLVLPAVARRIAGSLVLGSLLPDTPASPLGAVLGAATLAAAAFLAFRRGPLREERCIIGIVFALVLGSVLVRCRLTLIEFYGARSGSRYMYLPQLAVIWLLILTALQRGRTAAVAAVVAAWALFVNIPRLREPAYPDQHWGLYVARIRSGEAVTVPINPPGWQMALPARPK
jgi:hypothetical protein